MTQSIIDGLGIGEGAGDVGIKEDHIRSARIMGRIFADDSASEVVFFAHRLLSSFALNFLHTVSVPAAQRAEH